MIVLGHLCQSCSRNSVKAILADFLGKNPWPMLDTEISGGLESAIQTFAFLLPQLNIQVKRQAFANVNMVTIIILDCAVFASIGFRYYVNCRFLLDHFVAVFFLLHSLFLLLRDFTCCAFRLSTALLLRNWSVLHVGVLTVLRVVCFLLMFTTFLLLVISVEADFDSRLLEIRDWGIFFLGHGVVIILLNDLFLLSSAFDDLLLFTFLCLSNFAFLASFPPFLWSSIWIGSNFHLLL
mmetsp:Transcript_20975/g.34667  ORF Transcript_20975/g.34667 Transcript_20975/m.34667 type:complete len:237 (+) Transcript_20975:363-1073(+)